jgi:hypothetical protein
MMVVVVVKEKNKKRSRMLERYLHSLIRLHGS